MLHLPVAPDNKPRLGGGAELFLHTAVCSHNLQRDAALGQLHTKNFFFLQSHWTDRADDLGGGVCVGSDSARPLACSSVCPLQHIGPAIPEVSSIWFKLYLYHVTGQGPPSLLLSKGSRLRKLPEIFQVSP